MTNQPDPVPTDDDGPDCDTCGKTSCPGAQALANGDSTGCPYLPIAKALQYDRCEYGCSRTVAQTTVRSDVVPVVEALIAAPRPGIVTVDADTLDGWVEDAITQGIPPAAYIYGVLRAALPEVAE